MSNQSENPNFVITEKEYFKGREVIFSDEIRSNARLLLRCVNIILADYEEWLNERDLVLRPQSANCNSGIRTKEENQEIYRIINAQKKRQGLKEIPVATNSSHLWGQGIDIGDDYDLFKEYLQTDRAKDYYEALGIYFEHFDYTDTWVHMTTRKPASGDRFFKPY